MRHSSNDRPLFSVLYDYPSHQGMVLDGSNTLRKREESIDVTLIVEGQAFKAHKVVLSACSDYFRAMFTDNMIEAHKSEIHLNGINAKGFLSVSEYVYTCKITLNLSNVQDVSQAASHVQMLALVQSCSDYLEAEIDSENCVDIATIAETYSLTALKRGVYKIMNENSSCFAQTREFYRLSATQLETSLAYDLPVDCSEHDVSKIVVNWFFYQTDSRAKVDISEAPLIIRHVHFTDIPRKRIHTVSQEINRNRHCDWESYKIVVSEMYNQLSSQDSKIPTNLSNPRGMESAFLKIGGFGNGGNTNEITYKLTSKSKWKHLTKIPHVEQCNYGVAVSNNDSFIIGGCFNQFLQETVHPFGFKYSTLHNKWSTLNPMKIERCRFSSNVVGGKMYAVGGATESEEVDSNVTCTCECYDPAMDKWSMMEPSPVYLTQHAGGAYEQATSSKLFICGGIERDSYHTTNSMFCYDVALDKWAFCTPMLTPRADHVVLSIDNFLYVCGGWQEGVEADVRNSVDTIDVYDVEKDRWGVVTRVPTPRFHAGIVSISRKIYFIGGFKVDAIFDKNNTPDIECYDIDNDFWTTENKYPEDIWEHTCALLYVPKCRNGMDVSADI